VNFSCWSVSTVLSTPTALSRFAASAESKLNSFFLLRDFLESLRIASADVNIAS